MGHEKSDFYLRITSLLTARLIVEAKSQIDLNRHRMSPPELEECLGNLHFYLKEHQYAISHDETAMALSEEYDCARYHYLIGVQLERADKLTEAFKRYQAAIEIEPSFVDAYIELGGLLVKVEDFQGAYKCFTDALILDPDDLMIHHNLVQVLSQLARHDGQVYSQRLREADAAFHALKATSDNLKSDHIW